MSGLLDKLLRFAAASAGMIALPIASFFARSSGPASRVTFYDYLPLEEICTLDDFMVYDWTSGAWTFAGRSTRIDSVPTRVPARP